MIAPPLRPSVAFGRRCPGCRRWTMRLPADGQVPIMIAAPRAHGESQCGCETSSGRRRATDPADRLARRE